jgi:hypothetical protein
MFLQHLPPRTRRQVIVTSSLALTGVVGWFTMNYYNKNSKSTSMSSSNHNNNKNPNNNNGSKIQHMSARDFLQNKSENEHDELAKSLIENRQKSKQQQVDLIGDLYHSNIGTTTLSGGKFRYDVTKDGLLSSLKMVKELKQKEEDQIYKTYQQTGKYPIDNPNETFKRLRKEKEEITILIKQLEGKQPYLWGWIWR